MTVTVVPVPDTEFRETVPGVPSTLVECDSMTVPLFPLPFVPEADFGDDADVGAPDPVEVSDPVESDPSSWQDARVAARPMALTTARTLVEIVIMMGPPLLGLRPHRPEECQHLKQKSSSEKWGASHGEIPYNTRIHPGYPWGAGNAWGLPRGAMGSAWGAPIARTITFRKDETTSIMALKLTRAKDDAFRRRHQRQHLQPHRHPHEEPRSYGPAESLGSSESRSVIDMLTRKEMGSSPQVVGSLSQRAAYG